MKKYPPLEDLFNYTPLSQLNRKITEQDRQERDERIRLKRKLIELMKNFRLIYEIGSTGNLVAPQMLPENTPDYSWDPTDNSLMQFRYDRFMPSGMLWQFIVMMYRYIKNHDWVWRNGVTLQRDGTPR